MGRVVNCFDNAAIESWHSTLEFECLSRNHFRTKVEARRELARFIDWYNRERKHSWCGQQPPMAYEATLAGRSRAA
jgi:transposase InsO family protein